MQDILASLFVQREEVETCSPSFVTVYDRNTNTLWRQNVRSCYNVQTYSVSHEKGRRRKRRVERQKRRKKLLMIIVNRY